MLALHAWAKRAGSVAGRIQLALVTVTGLAFLWALHYWRLV
jgi:hypothetical protein